MRGRPFNFTEEEFIHSIKTSFSQKEAMIKLGYTTNSKNPKSRFFKLITKLNPDVSHFSFRSKSQTIGRGKGNSIEYYYNNYKSGATRYNRVWELTLQQFEELVVKECTYCGNTGDNYIGNKSVTNFKTYCGIDRIDNKIGYTKENCTTCCKYCNWMKRDMNVKEFLDRCKLICNNNSNK